MYQPSEQTHEAPESSAPPIIDSRHSSNPGNANVRTTLSSEQQAIASSSGPLSYQSSPRSFSTAQGSALGAKHVEEAPGVGSRQQRKKNSRNRRRQKDSLHQETVPVAVPENIVDVAADTPLIPSSAAQAILPKREEPSNKGRHAQGKGRRDVQQSGTPPAPPGFEHLNINSNGIAAQGVRVWAGSLASPLAVSSGTATSARLPEISHSFQQLPVPIGSGGQSSSLPGFTGAQSLGISHHHSQSEPQPGRVGSEQQHPASSSRTSSALARNAVNVGPSTSGRDWGVSDQHEPLGPPPGFESLATAQTAVGRGNAGTSSVTLLPNQLPGARETKHAKKTSRKRTSLKQASAPIIEGPQTPESRNHAENSSQAQPSGSDNSLQAQGDATPAAIPQQDVQPSSSPSVPPGVPCCCGHLNVWMSWNSMLQAAALQNPICSCI